MHDYTHTSKQPLPLSTRTNAGIGHQVIAAVSGAMSRVFHTTRLRTVIVGVNPGTRLLTSELQSAGKPVSLIGSEAEQKSNLFVSAMNLTTSDELLLGRAGAESARCLVAALPDDGRNLSICHTALEKFRVPVIVARLRLLEGVMSWAKVGDSGMARLSWKDLIHAIIPDELLTPALSRLAAADDRDRITDLEVRSPIFIGRTIGDLSSGDCDVVALRRKNNQIAAYETTNLELGDVLTVIGEKPAIGRLRESLTSL
jgi:Trk K+ transport system NAD-binding subunit